MPKRSQPKPNQLAVATRGEARSKQILIRLRPEELRVVDDVSKKLKMSRSDTVRHALGLLAESVL